MKDYVKNRLYSDDLVFKIGGDFYEITLYRLDDEKGNVVAYETHNKDLDLISLERLAKLGDLYADIFKQIYEQNLIINKIINNEIDFEYIKKLMLEKNLTSEIFKQMMFLKNYLNNVNGEINPKMQINYKFCENFYNEKMSKNNTFIQACNNSAEDSKQALDRKILSEQLENQLKQKEAEYIKHLENQKNIAPNNSRRPKL